MQLATPFFLLAVCLFELSFVSTAMAQTKSVEGKAIGRFYNEIFSTWSDQSVTVHVDVNRNFYLSAGDGILKCTTFFRPHQLKEVHAELRKILTYCDKARLAQLETTRDVAVVKNETKTSETGVRMTFHAANKGKQTDLVLLVIDFENDFNQIKLHIDRQQILQLIKMLERVPATLRVLLNEQNRADAVLGQ